MFCSDDVLTNMAICRVTKDKTKFNGLYLLV